MSLDRSKYYILGAFLAGAALAAAYNKRLSAGENENVVSDSCLAQQQSLLSNLAKIDDLEVLKKSLLEVQRSMAEGMGNIKEGIEGCIGDTPLIKIKSLSEYTGCDILAKAEVGNLCDMERLFC